MPLRVRQRGNRWVVNGRIELDGRAITAYYHNKSTGSFTEAGAIEWAQAETTRQKRRYLLGDKAERITLVMAIMEYNARPAFARSLTQFLKANPELGDKPIEEFTGKFLKDIGLAQYPHLSTDSVMRHVVAPIRAVINNMHELGKAPYLKVQAFRERERIDRDIERGIQSRAQRRASDKQWIETFCAHADIYNAALVRFMFETAARIDQAISLRPKDLDLMNKRVRLKAQKGHPEQWVEISHQMMIELANLPAKRPYNRKLGYALEARVFGYATPAGYRKAWSTICKKAGIERLTAHEAGRHGFGTELLVRQGLDAVTVAKAGRWASPQLVFEIYGHSETSQADIRERFRTKPVHLTSVDQHNNLKHKGD